MARSNVGKLKLQAVKIIARKAKLERRAQGIQEELVSTVNYLDKLVKEISRMEEATNAAPAN